MGLREELKSLSPIKDQLFILFWYNPCYFFVSCVWWFGFFLNSFVVIFLLCRKFLWSVSKYQSTCTLFIFLYTYTCVLGCLVSYVYYDMLRVWYKVEISEVLWCIVSDGSDWTYLTFVGLGPLWWKSSSVYLCRNDEGDVLCCVLVLVLWCLINHIVFNTFLWTALCAECSIHWLI